MEEGGFQPMKTKISLVAVPIISALALTEALCAPTASSQPPITSSQPPITSSQPPITSSQPPITSSPPPATTSQPPVTASQPPTGAGVPQFPTGAPRENYITNANGQVVIAPLPANGQRVLAPQPSGPPVPAGQPPLPAGAANQASAQMQFQQEQSRVNQMAGHAPQGQFAPVTNVFDNAHQAQVYTNSQGMAFTNTPLGSNTNQP